MLRKDPSIAKKLLGYVYKKTQDITRAEDGAQEAVPVFSKARAGTLGSRTRRICSITSAMWSTPSWRTRAAALESDVSVPFARRTTRATPGRLTGRRRTPRGVNANER